jgi:hypothetical protein
MRKLIVLAMSIALLCLILVGCDKDKTDVVKSDAELLQDFFKRNMVPSQNFTIDAGTGGVINTVQGTRIEFPPNALVTAAGQPVLGVANIEFKEINEKIDFLLSNKPTIANGLPLESGGTWKLEVKQNGQRLRIRPGVLIRMNIRRDAGQQRNMFLFNAIAKENDDAVALNWGQQRRPIYPLDSPYRNYFCNLDSVGWGNADVFMDNPDYATDIKIFGIGNNITADLSNFYGMFIYKGRKTVWPLEKNGTFFNDNHIAKYQPGHFVLFGFVNGAFKAGILEDQPVGMSGQTFFVNLSFDNEAAFKARLRVIL